MSVDQDTARLESAWQSPLSIPPETTNYSSAHSTEDLSYDQLHAKDEHGLMAVELPWRPPYLRRRILLCFLLIFVLMLVTVEVLLVVSDRNYGIADGYSDYYYLWTYGPTALLTLLAMFWARVEYQSKLVAP